MDVPVGVLPAAVAAFGLALQAVFVRVGTDEGRPVDAVIVGLATNVLVVVPLTLLWHYPEYGLTARAVVSFVTAGLVGSMAGRAFYFGGISRVGASRAEAVKASQSLHAALLAVVFVGETLAPAHLGAIVLIVGGLVLLASESADDPLTGERISLSALLWPLAGAFFFGVEPVIARIGFTDGTPTLVAVSLKAVAAMVGFLVYLRWRGALPTRRGLGSDLWWFVAAGAANTLFVVAYYWGLAISTVNVVVPIVQTSPLLVVALSAAVLRRHERITPRLVAAAAVVVAGAIGVTLFG